MKKKIKIKPSVFAEKFLNLDLQRAFRFKHREYFLPIYDSNAEFELFKTARQCAKSTYLCNRIITRAATKPSLQILYVAPKIEQAKTFSRQKVNPTLMFSQKLKPFLNINSMGNIDDKNILNFYCFKQGSYVKLSTTYNGVDRDRGIVINDLYVDEVQDQFGDDIDILKEGQSAQEEKYLALAGTPKSMGNYIERLWQDSRQLTWLMKCESCGYWQLPDIEYNIRESGLLCRKCESKLNVLNGQWVVGNSSGKYNGWHISQLMRLVKGMPGSLQWRTEEGLHGIWDKYQIMDPARFNNEVLGVSYDSATNPLTFEELKNCSIDSLKKQNTFNQTFFLYPVVMGIDWGCNNDNFTVVTIMIRYQDKPTIVYMERFSNMDSDPTVTAKKIRDLYLRFQCSAVFCDNGLYFHFKAPIESLLGKKFVLEKFNFIYYYQNDEKLIQRSKMVEKRLFKVCRNDIMNLFVDSLKKSTIKFYNFEEFTKDKLHSDFLSVGYEIRNSKDRGDRLFFLSSRDSGMPTDAFHSALYAWLGLSIILGKLVWFYEDDVRKGFDIELAKLAK